MKKLILLVSVCAVSFLTNAQTYDWANGFGSTTGNENAYTTAIDKQGNIITAGTYRGNMDVDPGPGVITFNNSGSADIFIQKVDDQGVLLWAKQISSTNGDNVRGIAVDDNDNVYLTGSFQGTVDFDPGSGVHNLTANTSFAGVDAFILKLNANGDFKWAYNFGGTGNGVGVSGFDVTTKNGFVYFVGEFSDSVDFNPGPPIDTINVGNWNHIYITKFDTAGNYIWAKNMGGGQNCQGVAIAVDKNENVYTTGYFQGTADFDPGIGTFNLSSSGQTDCFISKLNTNGDFVWAAQLGSNGYEYGYDIIIDKNDDLLIGGTFTNVIDFNPGAGTYNVTAGGVDGFVLKLDTNMNFSWVKQFENSLTDITNVHGLNVDNSNNIYIAGSFRGTCDFNPEGTPVIITEAGNSSSFDGYITQLNSSGIHQWTETIGNSGADGCQDIVLNSFNEIIFSGFYSLTVDFDPNTSTSNLTSNGSNDAFVCKWETCPVATSTDIQNACGSFTWIDNNTYTSSNNTATHTIIGGAASGCDSIITLNLTINTVDTTVVVNGNTLTANAFGASYRWLDCNNNMAVISGETNQSFNPTNNGSYALEITQNGCTDTSACHNIVLTGIGELNQNNINIYPNPTNNLITVELTQLFENLTVELLSIDGKIVKQQTINNSQKFTLDLSNQSKGIYFLKVNASNTINQFKIIKQ